MGRREIAGLTACAMAALSLIAACGQRGPLTLPEQPAPSAAQNDDEAQDDERDEIEQD